MSNGWICPKCHGAHGPHVDTCPVNQANPWVMPIPFANPHPLVPNEHYQWAHITGAAPQVAAPNSIGYGHTGPCQPGCTCDLAKGNLTFGSMYGKKDSTIMKNGVLDISTSVSPTNG